MRRLWLILMLGILNALAPFLRNAGSAAALSGFIQLSVGAVISAGVGLSDAKGTRPMAITMALSAGLALLLLRLGQPRLQRLGVICATESAQI